MMRDTPRLFVGPAVFELDGLLCSRGAAAVHREVGRLPGISRCELDPTAGVLLVTARTPVDRSSVVALLDGLGVHPRT
jgi:hypothetical protein